MTIMCDWCATDHDGHIAGSLGAKIACLRAQANRLEAVHVEAELDQVEARLRDERSRQLLDGA